MSELIDLVSISGEVIKRSVPREDADIHSDLYMQIVIAVITNSLGEVLVHERSENKDVNPNCLDHVCGGILSGESPEAAAIREAAEEVGVEPKNLSLVHEGVNMYGRYCYLLSGISDAPPTINPVLNEVKWARYISIDELHSKQASGEFQFVEGYFEDLDLVCAYLASKSASLDSL